MTNRHVIARVVLTLYNNTTDEDQTNRVSSHTVFCSMPLIISNNAMNALTFEPLHTTHYTRLSATPQCDAMQFIGTKRAAEMFTLLCNARCSFVGRNDFLQVRYMHITAFGALLQSRCACIEHQVQDIIGILIIMSDYVVYLQQSLRVSLANYRNALKKKKHFNALQGTYRRQ